MRCELSELALNLVRGAFMELYLTPKPGLVDLNDSGSHHDLTLPRMEESLKIVAVYLADLRDSLLCGEDLPGQVLLGMQAEGAMLERVGTNCHKGFIFLSGLLLSATARSGSREERAVSQAAARLARRFFEQAGPESNGSRARKRYRARGVRGEALDGLPSLFQQALPAFRRELATGGSRACAVYAMLGRLMATVEDTTALHRCGREGLATVREDGRKLELLVARRGDFLAFLAERNRHYIDRNLTMGGVADLLALAFAWLSHTGELDLATPDSLPRVTSVSR